VPLEDTEPRSSSTSVEAEEAVEGLDHRLHPLLLVTRSGGEHGSCGGGGGLRLHLEKKEKEKKKTAAKEKAVCNMGGDTISDLVTRKDYGRTTVRSRIMHPARVNNGSSRNTRSEKSPTASKYILSIFFLLLFLLLCDANADKRYQTNFQQQLVRRNHYQNRPLQQRQQQQQQQRQQREHAYTSHHEGRSYPPSVGPAIVAPNTHPPPPPPLSVVVGNQTQGKMFFCKYDQE
jgi:hypothetical protein